ncbi:MAG: HD domain-containing phosphohydrolase [Syntrophomonas sp.]
MNDENKAKEQLIEELAELRQRVNELESAEIYRQLAEAALKLSEERFSKAFQCNPDPITITTLGEGRYVEVNDAFLDATGYTRDEVVGRTMMDINIWVTPQERDFMIQQLRNQGYIQRGIETKFRTKSGAVKPFLYSTEIIDMNGHPHLLFVTKDISELKQAETALRLSEDKFAKAFNASPSSMLITSFKDGRFLAANDRFCQVIGYTQEELMNFTILDLDCWVDLNDRELIRQMILHNQPVRDMELCFKIKAGEQRLVSYSAEALEISGEACLLSIVTDITERKKAQEEISYLSFHDKLTGLYNRAYFEEELKRLDTERQLPISVIMGDVNGLKLINDALGHQEGDKLLIAVADVLNMSCRKEDIAARWGGDEFIILLPRCDSLSATRIMERVRGSCKYINDLPIQTIISLGLASKNSANQNMMDIIKEAEEKMYRNKLLESRSIRSSFLNSLENTLWTRSHETKEHCQRIQENAQKIGRAINLPESEMDNLRLLAALHDIGKIAITNNILDKPQKLTPEEWEYVKKHSEVGYRIAISSPEMAPVAQAILHHHEHWDGSGYPMGLKGADIPLISRIIAIADAQDVMVTGRPYQAAISNEEAWQEIKRCSGTQFDPELVRIAMEILL